MGRKDAGGREGGRKEDGNPMASSSRSLRLVVPARWRRMHAVAWPVSVIVLLF